MAQPTASFAAALDDWVLETKERTLAVFRGSAQEIIEVMQKPVAEGGNMPVDTGFLRASLQVNLNGWVPANRPNPSQSGHHGYNPTVAEVVIAGAKLGDTVYASYSANYAGHLEYGTSKTQPRAFVRLAMAQAELIVKHQTVRAMLTAYSNRRKG